MKNKDVAVLLHTRGSVKIILNQASVRLLVCGVTAQVTFFSHFLKNGVERHPSPGSAPRTVLNE